MATDQNTPVVWTDDGLRLILADGSVVEPILQDSLDELEFDGADQGAAVYSSGSTEVSIALVNDPDATDDHVEVEAVYENYDFR